MMLVSDFQGSCGRRARHGGPGTRLQGELPLGQTPHFPNRSHARASSSPPARCECAPLLRPPQACPPPPPPPGLRFDCLLPGSGSPTPGPGASSGLLQLIRVRREGGRRGRGAILAGAGWAALGLPHNPRTRFLRAHEEEVPGLGFVYSVCLCVRDPEPMLHAPGQPRRSMRAPQPRLAPSESVSLLCLDLQPVPPRVAGSRAHPQPPLQ